MKKICCFVICLCLLSGCTSVTIPQNKGDKLQIVATLFPQYDIARTIAGDLADVVLLLPPGAESHSYEPTPADIITINQADLFIYTGDAMEGWVTSILDSLESNLAILNISEGIPLHGTEHEMAHDEANHTHTDVDPHVFTNPRFVQQMAITLRERLKEIDTNQEHHTIYDTNAKKLQQELVNLDQRFRNITENSKRKKLIFGGRFPFLYFIEEYNLTYDAAYNSCSSESEPSAADIARLIDTVHKEQIPVVYYEELSDPKIARLICEETGTEPLILHSCHNISKEELANGATYISLMNTNADHLEKGLN
ncbi:MAG: zinc ABC transporter substrate-binding protein [Ruminococcaceae bacterium]|nr:zinc ABC transporter substrate-binding protein [Oscillospiraceae bacterium]